MKIYYINLARAPERRQKMEAQAAALHLTFERLEATDGKNLTAAERDLVDHDARKRISPYPLSDNEIGCWLSHLRAMKALIASGDAMACILEDDATLSPDFPRVLTAIEQGAVSFDEIDLHRLFKKGEVFVPTRTLLPGYALGRIGTMHMHLTAYVISRAGAEKFVHYATRFTHVVDKALHRYWANGLDIYGLEQPVARQEDGGHSYIDETRGERRPEERAMYSDANRHYWRAMRRWSRFCDTVQKRVAFRSYLKR